MLTKLDRLRTLRRFIGVQHRSYSAQISTHELDDDTKPAHRTKQRLQDETDVLKMAKDMRQHFSNVEKRSVLTAYPEHLVKKKSKLPTGLYNTCPHIARAIVDEVKKDLPADRPILEANPGIGKITDLLLRETKNDLILYEPDSFFHDGLNVSCLLLLLSFDSYSYFINFSASKKTTKTETSRCTRRICCR